MLGAEGNLNEGLGLEKDWAYNIVKAVGNYGEIYENTWVTVSLVSALPVKAA